MPIALETRQYTQEGQLPHSPGELIYAGNNFELIAGQSNRTLAVEIAKILEHTLDEPVENFKDGEINVAMSHNLRRKHAVLLQSTAPPHVNDYWMELFMMVDAARRASAAEITTVIPYFGYSRKDRKDQPRVAISASAVANILVNQRVDRIMTVDIHAEQSQGYILNPWDNLYASYSLVPRMEKIEGLNKDNLIIVAPDFGATTRTKKYAAAFKVFDIGVVYKQRDVKPNSKSNAIFFIGDATGKDVILTDDILNTGGTLKEAAIMLKSQGASRIFAAITHGIFLDNALKELDESPIEQIFVTDSIEHRPEVINHPKVEIVSIAPLLADGIKRIHTGQGLTSFFEN
jgi:ribose-phosphate pyrophosphokinase